MSNVLKKLFALVFAPSTVTRRQRRTLGTIVLVVVVGLVFLGGLFLKAGNSPGTSALFWGVCFLLLTWSVFLAYVDVRSIKQEFLARRKELFVSTFSKPGITRRRDPTGETQLDTENACGGLDEGAAGTPQPE